MCLLNPTQSGQNLYFHLNHPIKWIRLVGVIVAVDIYPTRCIMLLDDSSGATIEVTCGRQKPVQSAPPTENVVITGLLDVLTEGHTATGRSIDLRGVDIGSVVKLKGGIGQFRGEKQVLLERISIIYTTSEETAAWVENTEFRSSILNVPWVVSAKDEQRAKRKAEGLDREQKAQEARRRKRTNESVAIKTLEREKDRISSVEREKQMNIVTGRVAAENEKQRMAKSLRAQERKSREKEFERLKAEETCRELRSTEALKKEMAQMEEAQQAVAEVERQRHEEGQQLAAEFVKRRRTKSRRDEERQFREQEFEKLKRLQEKGGRN